jgi:hypothetical protein
MISPRKQGEVFLYISVNERVALHDRAVRPGAVRPGAGGEYLGRGEYLGSKGEGEGKEGNMRARVCNIARAGIGNKKFFA